MDNVIKQVTSTPEMQNAINSVLKQDDASAESAAAAGAAVATVNNIETTQNQQTDETAQKKTEIIAENSPTTTSTSNNQCTVENFEKLAQQVKRDTPINLPNCNANNMNYLKKLLTEACTKIPIINILKKDNKHIIQRMRDDKFDDDNSTYTCATREFNLTSLNGNKRPVDHWDVEADPGADACKSECDTISKLNLGENQLHEFNNPQCLKQCAPVIYNACKKINEGYFAMYQLYPVTMKFKYWCTPYNN